MKKVIKIKAVDGEVDIVIEARINTHNNLLRNEISELTEKLRDKLVESVRDLPYTGYWLSNIKY